MAFQDIIYRSRTLGPRKAITEPDFNADTVLVSDPWEYVDLWLKREKQSDARDYWQQAREFANATTALPPTSAPLAAYYCFLNATKALLTVRSASFRDRHGVHGENEPGKRSLQAEKVNFQGQGVLGALCRLLGEDSNPVQYSLKEALYNLPFIHRAYTLTYRSAPPLFMPLRNPRFVRKIGSSEAWFCAELEPRYHARQMAGKLPDGWEVDVGAPTPGTVRRKARFKWKARGDKQGNLERLTNYHREVRKHLFYIGGPMRLWYLKRCDVGQACIPRSSLTLTFAAMHRLSELSRYDPISLTKHLDRDHNWLLTEFITIAPRQFIDEIASEITGRDFMVPGTRI